MRIIAGEFRSRKLNTLPGNNTRPTLDKVKEAVFSSLGGSFVEGDVLDLFAGSGSVGLESLSRGMKEAYFCDMSRDAIKVIESNIKALKVEKRCHVYCMNYKSMLTKMKNHTFSLIYLDPPYALKVIEEILSFIDSNDMLDEYGSVVVESLKEDVYEERYGSLIKVKEKEYGITRITYFEKE